MTAQALGLGNASTYEEDRERIIAEYKANLEKNMKGWEKGEAWQKQAYDLIDDLVANFAFKINQIENVLNSATGSITVATTAFGGNNYTGGQQYTMTAVQLQNAWNALSAEEKQFYGKGLPSENMPPDHKQYQAMSDSDKQKVLYAYTRALVNSWSDGDADRANGGIDATINSFGDDITDTTQNRDNNAWSLTFIDKNVGGLTRSDNGYTGRINAAVLQGNEGFWGAVFNAYAANNWADPVGGPRGNEVADATAAADAAVNAVYESLHSMSVALETKYDAAGRTIATQEDAQLALDAINNAIIEKDKVRAHLGAIQNRLENTITNLNVQAENLQAAESRIRDVDVATEMTEFTRQQILTQTAVAMLSQANSLPQMAMQLVGG